MVTCITFIFICIAKQKTTDPPLAERTLYERPGKEKVRNTIVADAAMTAPSPESLMVTVGGGGCTPCFTS